MKPGPNRRSPAATACLGALVLVCLGGCSGRGFSTVPVKGAITYEDGTPIPAEAIQLRFRSLAAADDAGVTPRVGMVDVDVSDGSLGAGMTYEPGDGLIRGKHKFSISLTPPAGKRPTDLVPADYISADTSPITLDTSEMPWAIKVPKP